MIDLSTLLVLLLVADLILAAALVIGAGGRLRHGMSFWTASLAARALAVGLLAGMPSPHSGAPALAAGFLAACITLQAAALLALDRRRLPWGVHVAVLGGMAIPVQLLADDPGAALHFCALALGVLLALLATIAAQVGPPTTARTRGVLVGAFGLGAATCVARAIGGQFIVDPMQPLLAPTMLQSLGLVALYTVGLLGTFGFIALHKERSDAEARRLATVDPLTGAWNRAAFHEVAERELARARRAGQPLSIIMVDIDHFRAVNERHGHRVGDAVLQGFADRIRAALRKEDMLVRFGGEEFLVLLPEVAGPGAVVVAGRIRKTVAAEPIVAGEVEVAVTASLGVAARLDEGPESIDSLIARADSALAMAKDRGRDRVVALSLGRSIAA